MGQTFGSFIHDHDRFIGRRFTSSLLTIPPSSAAHNKNAASAFQFIRTTTHSLRRIENAGNPPRWNHSPLMNRGS